MVMAIATEKVLANKPSNHVSNLLTIKLTYQKEIPERTKFIPQAVHAAASEPPSAVAELQLSQYHCQQYNGKVSITITTHASACLYEI